MQEHIARNRMAADPADLEINPSLGHLQLMDFHRAAETIAMGYETAVRALDTVALPAAPRLPPP
jgi:NTE family protein